MPRAAVLAFLLTVPLAASATPKVIPLKLPSGKALEAELMVEQQDLAMGLMFRPSLPEDRALLFVFQNLDFHAIWMKNCKFPIDILWLDEQKQVVHVAADTPPCKADPCPAYEPLRRAAYVVEINAGKAAREKLALGSVLSFELP